MKPYLRNPMSEYLKYLWNRAGNRRRFQNYDQGYLSMVTGTSCGPNFRVDHHSSIVNCRIGGYSYVSHHAELLNAKIGKFCSIGQGCRIGLGQHPTDQISTSPVFFSTKQQAGISFVSSNLVEENREISIGNDVWIGANAVILDGVEIGTGAIVAAGAVVTKNVLPYTIIAGVPAVAKRRRFSDQRIGALLRSAWWDWSPDELSKHAEDFADANSFIDRLLTGQDQQSSSAGEPH